MIHKYTTPTIVFTLPEEVNLNEASDVYVTFATDNFTFTKTDNELTIDKNVVTVVLTQEETAKLKSNKYKAQLNWIYVEGVRRKRACSVIVEDSLGDNLYKVVI